LNFCHEERSDKTVSRAKSAKGAKVDFEKKRLNGRGPCELGVLGAIYVLNSFCETIAWLVSA